MTIKFMRNATLAALVFLSNAASAGWITSVDQFQIDKNGSTAWVDNFSTDQSASYNVTGNFVVNTSTGRATMNSDLGDLGPSGIIPGVTRYFTRARRGVPGDNVWLNETDSFIVSGLFDLGAGAIPDSRGRMGMRLNDACPTCNNNDLVDISLRNDGAGNFSVRFMYNNDVRDPALADGYDFVQDSGILDLTAYDQIVFFLRNNGQGGIEGGYALLDSAAPSDLSTLAASATWFTDAYSMFTDETRVRAELFTTKRVVAPVPEPATYLMFGLGLIGVLTLRRRIKKG